MMFASPATTMGVSNGMLGSHGRPATAASLDDPSLAPGASSLNGVHIMARAPNASSAMPMGRVKDKQPSRGAPLYLTERTSQPSAGPTIIARSSIESYRAGFSATY